MNYSKSNLISLRGLVVFFALFNLLVSACQKDSASNKIQETVVKVNMSGVGNNVDIATKSSTSARRSSGTETTIIPFNDEYSIVASVKTVGSSNISTTGSGNKAAVTEQVTALKTGTQYTIAVYSSAGAYVTHQSFTYTAGQTPQFTLPPANYTFVVVASGNNTLPSINFNQALSAINWNVPTASMDVMYFKQALNVQEGAANILDVILKHKFTEVKVTVDTKAIGTSQVATGTVTPNFPSVTFALENGTIDYTGAGSSTNAALTFPTTSGTELVSNPLLLLTQGQSGSITVPVTINGTTKPVNHTRILAEGVSYEITLRIQRNGINIGGGTFSPGNLLYNPSTGEYSFAPSNGARGDYFFSNYVKAKLMNVGNITPNSTDNGASGDPCALVYPLDYWRLPTEAEANTLIDAITPPPTGGNWTPNPYQNNTLVDYFNGPTTDLGMFYGTQTHPASNNETYLFLGLGGYYENTDQSGTVGTQGRFLLKSTTGYTSLLLTGTQGTTGFTQIASLNQNAAVQIRCIKK